MNKSVRERRQFVTRVGEKLSVTRQCELLGLPRSGVYYTSVGESAYNLELMRLIDEHHMLRPWMGVPRITDWLNLDMGHRVNSKRVARLFKLLGIEAIGPSPNTSKAAKGSGHKVCPYLLRGLKVVRPDQVWATDITYIPVQGGYLYPCAVIDLYSRYVVNCSLSNIMTAQWCRDTLDGAVEKFGVPQILNTDQGSQFTSEIFTSYVMDQHGFKLSMDGKGRAIDNIFIERLWRSVKHEHVYLFPAADGIECYKGLETYFNYYNNERRHSSLDKARPADVYFQQRKAA